MDTKRKNENCYFWCCRCDWDYLAKKYLKDNHEILLFTKNLKSKKKLNKLLNLKKIDKVIIDYLNIEKKNSILKKINKYSFF